MVPSLLASGMYSQASRFAQATARPVDCATPVNRRDSGIYGRREDKPPRERRRGDGRRFYLFQRTQDTLFLRTPWISVVPRANGCGSYRMVSNATRDGVVAVTLIDCRAANSSHRTPLGPGRGVSCLQSISIIGACT